MCHRNFSPQVASAVIEQLETVGNQLAEKLSVRMRDGPFKSEEVALAAGKIALREFLELLESEQESDA